MTSAESYRSLLRALKGDRWDGYQEAVDYSKKISLLAEGNDKSKEELLKQFTQREDKALFEQRKKFTQLVTPSIFNKIRVPFSKIMRNDDIQTVYSPEEKSSEIDSDFFAGKPILNYLDSRIKDEIFIDPNSHIVITFDDFDSDTEKAKPYPVVYASKECVVRHETRSGELDLLVTQKEGVTIAWTKSLGYDTSETSGELSFIQAVESDSNAEPRKINAKDIDDEELALNGELISIGGKKFVITYGDQKTDHIPAKRVGYWLSAEHGNKICISPIHYAINRMMKTVKTSSELDLTTMLHSFPQKIVARERCRGAVYADEHYRCDDGHITVNDPDDPEGGLMRIECTNCKGSGYEPVHTTAGDVIHVDKPEHKDDQLDLDNIIKYISVDTATPEFQDRYLEKLETNCIKDVFASSAFSMQNKQTATEVSVEFESVYDVIDPYKNQISELYVFIAKIVATFKEVKIENVVLAFPSDLRLKPANEIIRELNEATTAPPSIRKNLMRQLIQKSFQNQPLQRREELIKLELMPFAGHTVESVATLLAMGSVEDIDKYIYSNFDKIIRQIKIDDNEYFLRSMEDQVEILYKTAEEMRGPVTLPQPEGDLDEE